MQRSGGVSPTRDDMDEIFARLPTKSVIRFRIGCKSWFSATGEPHFVATHLHHLRNSRPPSILHHRSLLTVISNDWVAGNATAALSRPLPSLAGKHLFIHNSCNGLLCFSSPNGGILLMNPSLGETLTIREPPKEIEIGKRSVLMDHSAFIGFHPIREEYKIVRFDSYDDELTSVEVCTLGTTHLSLSWRQIDGPAWPPENFGVAIAETMYWIANDTVDDGSSSSDDGHEFIEIFRFIHNCILAFDLGTEKFQNIHLPRIRIRRSENPHYTVLDRPALLELDGSICVAGSPPTPELAFMDIWMLDRFKNTWSFKYRMDTPWLSTTPILIYNDKFVINTSAKEIGEALCYVDLNNGSLEQLFNPGTVFLNTYYVHMETLVTIKNWCATP